MVALGNGKYTVYEVMTGIESGGWQEIIAGLKEGDEVVTSAQFLIDSEASLAGSIHRLDAHDMAASGDTQQAVFGSGIVEALDPASRRIRISHGPIEALGWTAMTMEFDVLPGANLDTIKIGQSIHFSLSTSKVGDYVISNIHQPEPAGVDEGSMEAHKNHHEPESGS